MAKQNRFKDISNLDRIKRIERIRPVLSLKDTISYCIKKGYKLDFMYAEDGDKEGSVLSGFRNVAPAAVGKHISTGNEVMRAYLMGGISKSKRSPYWRLFRLDRIKSYNINFSKTKVGSNKSYSTGDKHMEKIYTEINKGFKNLISI